MKLLQRKTDFLRIMANMADRSLWSESETKIPITQSSWFSQLIMLAIQFNRAQSKVELKQFAFEVFGNMCHYIKKNYNANSAKDLLSALELYTIISKGANNDNFMIDIMRNIANTGYERCGTATLIPYLVWFDRCGLSLRDIREILILELNQQEHAIQEEYDKAELQEKSKKPD